MSILDLIELWTRDDDTVRVIKRAEHTLVVMEELNTQRRPHRFVVDPIMGKVTWTIYKPSNTNTYVIDVMKEIG